VSNVGVDSADHGVTTRAALDEFEATFLEKREPVWKGR
jgi:hypothetical protein